MVVGAHADDIEVLAGGTLWKYRRQGHEVVYVMSTDNMSGGVHTLQLDGSVTTTYEPPEQMSARRKRDRPLCRPMSPRFSRPMSTRRA